MTYERSGPGGLATAPAPKADSHPSSYPAERAVQTASEAERRLVAAGWRCPLQLAVDADRAGLHFSDFGDRLCGVVVGYLRVCGENGDVPTPADAEAWLDYFAVPRESDELRSIVDDTSVPSGDSLVDLIGDVLGESQDRNAELCRKLGRDGLRNLHHAFNCPRCIRCARGEQHRPRDTKHTRPQRRVVYAK